MSGINNINNISPLPQIPVFIMCSITISSIPSIWIDYLPDMTNMWSSRFQWFVHTSFSPRPNRSCARDANHLNMNTKDDLFFQAHIFSSFGSTALLITLTRVESIMTHREHVKPAYFVPETSRYSESQRVKPCSNLSRPFHDSSEDGNHSLLRSGGL